MVRPATLRDHFQFDPPNCDLGSRADPEPVPDPLQVAVGGPLGLTAAWRSPELIKPWTIRSTTSRCRRISRAASHGWVPARGSPIQLQKRVLKSGTHPGVLPDDHLCRPLLAWLQRRRSPAKSGSSGGLEMQVRQEMRTFPVVGSGPAGLMAALLQLLHLKHQANPKVEMLQRIYLFASCSERELRFLA